MYALLTAFYALRKFDYFIVNEHSLQPIFTKLSDRHLVATPQYMALLCRTAKIPCGQQHKGRLDRRPTYTVSTCPKFT